MKNIILTLLFHCGFFVLLTAQSKQDYHWIFGNDQDGSENLISLKIDFNQVPFEIGTRSSGLTFDQNNASISDSDGNLLFYTNGCAVAEADHEIMLNGDSINEGPFFEQFWLGDCKFGYPGKQDIIILNDPGNDNGYYIIHKPVEFDPELDPTVGRRYLSYTYVDMSLNDNKGEVIEKNIAFFDGGNNGVLSSFLGASLHDNKKDWWITQPLWRENTYLSILLTENGFEEIDTQEMIRPHDDINSSGAGNTRFSPDGNTYAYFTQVDGLHVFDFDRDSGLLNNPRSYMLHEQDNPRFGSIEFSSNSQFLYFMIRDSLWQADLSYSNLEDGIEFIAEWNGISDPFATTFFDAALAPDCRIYIRSGSSTQSVHVIHKPNEKGQACNFVQQGIQFPFTNSTGTWPHSPRWRVDEEEKCDPSIVSMFGELVYYRHDLSVYPNPTTGPLTIVLPDDLSDGRLAVLDNQGQMIHSEKLSSITTEYRMDLSSYPSGIYHVEYLPSNDKERRIYTAKVVVE